MKKIIFTFLLITCFIGNVKAASYLSEMGELGTMAGIGMACDASKFDAYEMISVAIIRARAKNDRQEAEGAVAYSQAKADSYYDQTKNTIMPCNYVNQRFNTQQIFETVIYKDGAVTTPDGKTFKPRKPYNISTNISPEKLSKIRQNAIKNPIAKQHQAQKRAEQRQAPAIGHISRKK